MPVRVWQDSDGGQTLAYSSQPFGRTGYMVKLGPDGKLVGVRDTLDCATCFSIEPDITPEPASRLPGRERSRVFFKLSGEDVWACEFNWRFKGVQHIPRNDHKPLSTNSFPPIASHHVSLKQNKNG